MRGARKINRGTQSILLLNSRALFNFRYYAYLNTRFAVSSNLRSTTYTSLISSSQFTFYPIRYLTTDNPPNDPEVTKNLPQSSSKTIKPHEKFETLAEKAKQAEHEFHTAGNKMKAAAGYTREIAAEISESDTNKKNATGSKSARNFLLLSVCGFIAGFYLFPWLWKSLVQEQSAQKPKKPNEKNTQVFFASRNKILDEITREIQRIEPKYNSSICDGVLGSWISQGTSHKKKIMALIKLQKEIQEMPIMLTQSQVYARLSPEAKETFKAAYNYSWFPEDEDQKFYQEFMNGSFKSS